MPKVKKKQILFSFLDYYKHQPEQAKKKNDKNHFLLSIAIPIYSYFWQILSLDNRIDVYYQAGLKILKSIFKLQLEFIITKDPTLLLISI